MKYYSEYNGQAIGPMTAEQVVSYSVNKDTMVSAEGGEWRPLYTFPELMEKLGKAPVSQPKSDSMKTACGVLAILIGWLGLQYFLIGKTAGGLINIGLSLITCGAWSVINLIQGIMILCMSDEQWRQKYVDSTSVYPLF